MAFKLHKQNRNEQLKIITAKTPLLKQKLL